MVVASEGKTAVALLVVAFEKRPSRGPVAFGVVVILVSLLLVENSSFKGEADEFILALSFAWWDVEASLLASGFSRRLSGFWLEKMGRKKKAVNLAPNKTNSDAVVHFYVCGGFFFLKGGWSVHPTPPLVLARGVGRTI
jgi:hypothetical protein